jgi:hypothetical protein
VTIPTTTKKTGDKILLIKTGPFPKLLVKKTASRYEE